MKDSPFNVVPMKGQYMWRDMERLCAAEGLPFMIPAAFPQNALLAARTAMVGAREGWIAAYSPAGYRANFAAGRDIFQPATLAPLIKAAGGDPNVVLARARTDEIKTELRRRRRGGQQGLVRRRALSARTTNSSGVTTAWTPPLTGPLKIKPSKPPPHKKKRGR